MMIKLFLLMIVLMIIMMHGDFDDGHDNDGITHIGNTGSIIYLLRAQYIYIYKRKKTFRTLYKFRCTEITGC